MATPDRCGAQFVLFAAASGRQGRKDRSVPVRLHRHVSIFTIRAPTHFVCHRCARWIECMRAHMVYADVCMSRAASLWPQDGFVIVAHSNPSIISQQLALLLMLISSSFVNFISFFLLLLLFMGHLFWLCERGQNPDQFRPFYSQVPTVFSIVPPFSCTIFFCCS